MRELTIQEQIGHKYRMVIPRGCRISIHTNGVWLDVPDGRRHILGCIIGNKFITYTSSRFLELLER